jgi:hypothetical protein
VRTSRQLKEGAQPSSIKNTEATAVWNSGINRGIAAAVWRAKWEGSTLNFTGIPSSVLIDPLIYCWYELVSVYLSTIKEMIHEEFGDGIMSAIDFSMEIVRQPDPKGDRVNIVLLGKFLPYKQY